MLEFISKDVRECMEQDHLEFTDIEKAALIFHADLPVLERLERLEKMAEGTEDALLREQILARLAYDRQDMEAFWNNIEGYVYAVKVNPYDNCGYFASADTAYDHGMKFGGEFKIKKYSFAGPDDQRNICYPSKLSMRRPDVIDCDRECGSCAHPVAVARYGKDGTLEYFYSSEIGRPREERISRFHDSARFENVFIRIPNPFERGDIVRSTTEGKEHGIVATPQQRWRDHTEWMESRKWKGNFYDACIRVSFFQKNRFFIPDQISPAFLEKYEPQKSDADYDVLMKTSGAYQGK